MNDIPPPQVKSDLTVGKSPSHSDEKSLSHSEEKKEKSSSETVSDEVKAELRKSKESSSSDLMSERERSQSKKSVNHSDDKKDRRNATPNRDASVESDKSHQMKESSDAISTPTSQNSSDNSECFKITTKKINHTIHRSFHYYSGSRHAASREHQDHSPDHLRHRPFIPFVPTEVCSYLTA